MFPLKMHPQAYEKSKAILCEKSIGMLEDAYNNKPLPKPSCDTKAVDESIALGEKLGISSTPTSILPDGRVVPGAIDAKTLIGMIGNSP